MRHLLFHAFRTVFACKTPFEFKKSGFLFKPLRFKLCHFWAQYFIDLIQLFNYNQKNKRKLFKRSFFSSEKTLKTQRKNETAFSMQTFFLHRGKLKILNHRSLFPCLWLGKLCACHAGGEVLSVFAFNDFQFRLRWFK